MKEGGKSLHKVGFESLLDFVYPSLCLICDASISPLNALICPNCWQKAAGFSSVICLNCRSVIIDASKCPHCPPESAFPVLALGQYVDPLKEIIHQFKYHGYHRLGKDLAERLTDTFQPILEKTPLDCLVPIPLDSHREKKRGFNQAAILADTIGKKLSLPVDSEILVKARKTKDQTKLDPLQREKNMKGAFRVEDGPSTGRRILIVDDVVTTGATLLEAVQVLKLAGQTPVLATVVAIAGR